MTTKRSTSRTKRTQKKLKLRKETLRDLDTKRKGKAIKGGRAAVSRTCGDLCTITCFCPTPGCF
jgi:hypothetical protein